MHSEKKYAELAEKWMNGTITPEEERLFAEWYNASQDEEVFVPRTFAADEEKHRNRILRDIHRNISDQHRRHLPRWIPAVAAAVLILAGAGALWWNSGRSAGKPLLVANNAGPVKPIVPTDKATLMLDDGSTVDLEAAKDGSTTANGAARIDRHSARLVYNGPKPSDPVAATPATVYNTLTTPRGGLYSIVLPDGTKAWLNASSSLRYPTVFNGPNREVTLTGEGYFEVAPNATQPFKVRVGVMTVDVLGTRFDVMAYDDEPAVATTLLQGSVSVHTDGKQLLLAPGEQSLLTKEENSFHTAKADLNQAVAWKNGIFQFKSEDIRSIMRKVSRWYDVDIQYEGEIGEHFTGQVSREADVTSVLKQMELTNLVHFRVEGKRITVTP